MAEYIGLIKNITTTVLKGQIPPTDVIKLFISKSLGFAILGGACITKLPQISAIVRSGSAAGLNPLSFELEALGYLIHTTYGALAGLAFNAYGEAAILFFQALVLLLLIYRLSGTPLLRALAVLGVLGAFAASVITGRVGLDVVRVAFDANNLVFMCARLPQIITNLKNQSTGQLSLATSAINLCGGLARIFTSITEGAGAAMVRTYVISLFLNGTLVAQILLYKGKGKSKGAAAGAKKAVEGKKNK